MRHTRRDEPDFDMDSRPSRKEISAEAASEYSNGPSYEELWREPRRAPAQRPAPKSLDRLPTLAALGAVVLGASAMIGMREKIVRILPPTASAYSALGLPVNVAGLELRGLRSRIAYEGQRRVLTIEGEIVNLRRDSNAVPPVALTVRGDNGMDRYAWTAPAPKPRLAAGETIAFRARLASPPADGADVLVRFAKLESTKAPTTSRSPATPRLGR